MVTEGQMSWGDIYMVQSRLCYMICMLLFTALMNVPHVLSELNIVRQKRVKLSTQNYFKLAPKLYTV